MSAGSSVTKRSKGPSADHSHEVAEEKREQDEALDAALEATFPASDPVSMTQPMRSISDHPAEPATE